MYTGVLFPVRSDCSGFDSSTPEGMRGILGAELKFMGHDRKLSLLPPAPPPQPHRERACTQATIFCLLYSIGKSTTLQENSILHESQSAECINVHFQVKSNVEFKSEVVNFS